MADIRTKTCIFSDGQTRIYEYEKGDMDALVLLADEIIQEQEFPDKNENGSYMNPLASVLCGIKE